MTVIDLNEHRRPDLAAENARLRQQNDVLVRALEADGPGGRMTMLLEMLTAQAKVDGAIALIDTLRKDAAHNDQAREAFALIQNQLEA